MSKLTRLMTIKNFSDFLLESSTHSYGCAMIFFDAKSMADLQSKIANEDLYTTTEVDAFGLEMTPHVTLLYGIHDDKVNDEDVIRACCKIDVQMIVLCNVSCFENEKFDVLKFDVYCPELTILNKELKKFPYTDKFPEYHPHSTVAYLKPGKGKEYVKKLSAGSFTVIPSKIVYSKPDGTKKEKMLTNEIV